MYIPDNYDQFKLHEARIAEAAEKLPVCDECGEPIQSDDLYEFDGLLICPDCLKSNHRKCIDNYIE